MSPRLDFKEIIFAQSYGGLGNVIAPRCPNVVIRPMLELIPEIAALFQREELDPLLLQIFLIIGARLCCTRTHFVGYFVQREVGHLKSGRRIQSVPLLSPVQMSLVLLIFEVYDIVIIGSFAGRVVRVSDIGLHFGHLNFLTNFLFRSVM